MGRKKKVATTAATIAGVEEPQSGRHATREQFKMLNDVFMHQGERVVRLEEWQREIDYKTRHYDDLDSMVADAAKTLNEFAAWKAEVKEVWRRQPAVQQGGTAVKNQDIARLEGLMETYGIKLEKYVDDLLRIERRYLFPETYKESAETAGNVITLTVDSLEKKMSDLIIRVRKLEDSNIKLRHQADTAAKVLADVKMIKERLGLPSDSIRGDRDQTTSAP